jgi:endonuclease/exonuclease/phosphatase (EEP) superfamily protein YafD
LGLNLLELLSAFAHFTFLLSLALALLAIAFRLYILAFSGLLTTLICGALVIPHFDAREELDSEDFSIAQFNVYHNNPTPEQAILELSVQNADIFTIQELNSDWSRFTDSVFETSHPYTIEAPWDSCCYGTGLYSKFQILSYEVLGIENTPVIVAVIDVRGTPVTIVSLHTYAPAFPNETKRRNAQLNAVAELTSTEKDRSVIAIGDFNIVPWDRTFKDFLEKGKLTALRDGFQATYPMDLGFPLIPIDHITFSGNLIPTFCETVTIPGSDHRGMVAGFKFNH